MDATIKTQWVAALQSGEFAQGQGRLLQDGQYCCLGVLCELYIRETGATQWASPETEPTAQGIPAMTPDDEYAYLEFYTLSPAILTWAALTDDTTVTHLMELNDTGASFSDIAAVIDAKL